MKTDLLPNLGDTATWVAISGSRLVNHEVEADVRRVIRDIANEGKGLVVGGATGVDYIATDEMILIDSAAARLKIIIPTSFRLYRQLYQTRIEQGKVSRSETDSLFAQLDKIYALNPSAIIELHHLDLTPEAFHQRNSEILNHSTSLIAFQVNGSPGTQNTLATAAKMGMKITRYEYQIN